MILLRCYTKTTHIVRRTIMSKSKKELMKSLKGHIYDMSRLKGNGMFQSWVISRRIAKGYKDSNYPTLLLVTTYMKLRMEYQ